MDEDRKRISSSSRISAGSSGMLGGFYAKAKQRVLNKMGRSTTLTRNPKVDRMTKRIEEIKAKKAAVSSLASVAKANLKSTRKTLIDLDNAMMEAYKAELGEFKSDETNNGGGARLLHPEEKKRVADMERAMARCMETMNRVVDSYLEHLEDTARKPLTYNTPDEQARLSAVGEAKKKYVKTRTAYSDYMIDADAELAAGKELSDGLRERMEEAKAAYDVAGDIVVEEATKFEQVYREELAQRVSAHFTAEQQLLRGVGSAMQDLYPHTRRITLERTPDEF